MQSEGQKLRIVMKSEVGHKGRQIYIKKRQALKLSFSTFQFLLSHCISYKKGKNTIFTISERLPLDPQFYV